MSRPGAKGKRDGALSGFSQAMPKRAGASKSKSKSRGRSKSKQGGLEQLMGKVAGAAGGGKGSKRGPAIMALVGAGGAGIAALGKKRKAKDQAN